MRDETIAESSEALHSGKQSVPKKLTKPSSPCLMSAERSKVHNESAAEPPLTTEDRILKELENRGSFKARPLNRKLFEPLKTDDNRILTKDSRMETTKFIEFNLTKK